MKLWHDDVRPPPKGWEWARNNDEAKTYLVDEDVEEISLDHDMGYDGQPPGQCEECAGFGRVPISESQARDIGMTVEEGQTYEWICAACDGDGFIGGDVLYVAGDDEDDGRKLVAWMIENDLVPPKVTIHSWNPDGAAEMAAMLQEAGHQPEVLPFSLERFRQEAHLYGL